MWHLDSRVRIAAFEVIEADGGWAVLLDEYVPEVDLLPRVAFFPQFEDARTFAAAVRAGMSSADALEILLKSKIQ